MPGFKFQEGSGIPVVWIGKEPQDIPVSNPILFVYDFDWDSCLSPWPSPKVFKKGNDFAGNADTFLAELKGHLPQKSILAGYSLAGLFALYAATKENCFAGVLCASGSLWYPGWIDWLKAHPVQAEAVYLSLGDTEKNSRNPVLASVEDKTLETQQYLSMTHTFVKEPGSHFADDTPRVVHGIQWLNSVL